MATYYLSATGSDSNNGLSAGAPWQNLSKVNSTALSAGDNVLFKCGDTFRGFLHIDYSGTSGNPITFDSYGSGSKPKILGSKDYSNPSLWMLYSGNIWCTKMEVTTATDVANLIFDNEAGYGVKKISLNLCTQQGHWYINPSDSQVYIFSASNPGSYYSHIEIGGAYIDGNNQEVIKLDEADYIHIRNLDIRYSPNNGILYAYGCVGGLVEYCDVSWIGGMYVPSEFPVRMGNGIGVWQGGTNIIIRYNRVDQCYDAGISPQGGDGYAENNIQMYCNVITNCYYSFEWFTRAPNTFNNVNFYNNTCVNAGYQWSQVQRPDNSAAEHIRNADSNPSSITNCNIKNNIFAISARQGHEFSLRSGVDLDYNLYYVNIIGKDNPGPNTYTTLAQWQAAFGYDMHSLSTNPYFVSSSDFHLTVDSPAIDAGVNVGYGNDIGAYQFDGVLPTRYVTGTTSITFGGSAVVPTYTLECVPDREDITLDEVLHVVDPSGSCLDDAFANAVAEYLDPAYEGAHTCLSNFRNYCIHRTYLQGAGSSDITFTNSATGRIAKYVYNGEAGSSILFTNSATGQVTAGQVCVPNLSGYGALYNWYAANDARNICASGWHVPTVEEFGTLLTELGGWDVAGGKMKEIGFTYWNSPNTGADNSSGFSAKGSGQRTGTGSFDALKVWALFWVDWDDYDPDIGIASYLYYNSKGLDIANECYKKTGIAIRLIKDDSTLEDYTGNDGRVYNTVKIGSQVWLSENLAETLYRNLEEIPYVADNIAWSALVTGAYCYYDNDSSYALTCGNSLIHGSSSITFGGSATLNKKEGEPQIRTATGSSSITFSGTSNMPPAQFLANLYAIQSAPGQYINVSWSTVTGVTGYVLQRMPLNYSGTWLSNWKNVYVGTNNTFEDYIQNEGVMLDFVSVIYRICAYNSVGTGAWSSEYYCYWYAAV